MSDIGQLCFQCADLGDDDCKMCPLGNPCLNCEDYDKVNGICKSNGGCAPERRNDGQNQS
jgi:hypothetical protein